MIQIRHKECGSRLFDSQIQVEGLSGPMPDLSIKCPRCSRAQKKEVLAHYRFKTTKKQAPSIPEKLFCQNLECMALIGSLALPYTLRNQTSHIEIMCHACKEISHVQLLNIVEVE